MGSRLLPGTDHGSMNLAFLSMSTLELRPYEAAMPFEARSQGVDSLSFMVLKNTLRYELRRLPNVKET